MVKPMAEDVKGLKGSKSHWQQWEWIFGAVDNVRYFSHI
jgi:hypothetical protein